MCVGLNPAGCLIAALLLSLAVAPAKANDACAENRIHFRAGAAGGNMPLRTFSAELAQTAASRAKGLMHRRSMPLDHGMFFVFEKIMPVTFWMKDTPLPLDILFLDQSGKICSIAAHTTPFSLDLIPSGCAVQTVFEINAGQAAKNDLAVGSVARHPAIKAPAWPCD